jgi:hypothetical protein
MSEISVVVVGSTSINSVVGNGDTVNINVGDQTVGGGDGSAATIQVGSVTTLEATQAASIVNVGTAYAAKLDFAIPRGYTGSAGPANTLSIGSVSTGATAAVSISGTSPSQSISFVLQPGPTGPANSLSIGSVSTGTTAAVSITGTAPSQSLSFVLPRGPEGPANSLSIGSVSTGATAAVSITGTSPSQSLSFVLQPGPTGPANSLSIGSVSTGATAAVSISGEAPSQSLSFVLQPGPVGPANSLSIGSVSTGATAAVSISGDAPSQSLSFVLPVGPKGDAGPVGPAGPAINLGDETPQPLGVANAGTALNAARADHVHATLTSFPYGSLTGVPLTFAPSTHTHAIADVTGLQTALDSKQPAGSYVTLVNGTVPSSMLPSFVDDVREAASLSAFPATGDAGVIYVAVDTKKIYRWSGSAYVEISPSPGSTDSVTEGSTNLYFTNTRAAAAAPVQSVNTKTGTVTLTASDVGAAATSHKHTLADISQSSATTGQVPTWNGTAWAAATPSAGGGGGSENIVEAATAVGFPATGASQTLYIATDASRVYRWDSSGVYVEIGTAGGGGGIGGDDPRWGYFKPSAPTSVTAAAGNSQVSLAWNAPANVIAQAPIGNYFIQFSANAGSSWTTYGSTLSTATSAVVTGLTNGTAHTFRVAAVNAIGIGDYSTASSAVTPVAVTPDEHFANVSLLLHLNADFADSSLVSNAFSGVTSSDISTSVKKFGAGSYALTSNVYKLSDPAAMQFGSVGTFTVECFVYPTSFPITLWQTFTDTGGLGGHIVASEANGQLVVYERERYAIPASSSTQLALNRWQHVALSVAADSCQMYIDGARVSVGGTFSAGYGSSGSNKCWIGGNIYGGAGGGYIDEFRVTKNVARYNGLTLVEPTAAFPDS